MKFLFLLLTFLTIPAMAAWEVVPPLRNTYTTSSALTTPYATPTDLCMIGNPTSGVINVYHIKVSGYQTTAGYNPFYLAKRSTFTTCAETTLTAVPHNQGQPDSYSDIQFCTAAPSLGTLVGNIRGEDVFFPAPTTAALGSTQDWDFGPNSGVSPISLHNNEMLAVNFNSYSVPAGMRLFCEFTWQEQ